MNKFEILGIIFLKLEILPLVAPAAADLPDLAGAADLAAGLAAAAAGFAAGVAFFGAIVCRVKGQSKV